MRAQTLWAEHAAFMDALAADGFVVLGGPLGSPEHPDEVLLVVSAPDAGAVRARLAGDPWSAADLLRVTRVARWTILLDGRPA